MTRIFLSHSSDDKKIVRDFRKKLVAEGYDAWIDELELSVGDSLIEKINNAITESDCLLIFITKNSIKSDWVKREVRIAIDEQKLGRNIKVLPLLIQRCDPENIIKDIVYADFTKKETRESQFKKCCSAIGLPRVEHASTVFFHYRMCDAFPGVHGVQWFAGKEAVRRLDILLKKPLRFFSEDDRRVCGDPIWWRRGSLCLPIFKYRPVLNWLGQIGDRCILEDFELAINRIMVYKSVAYWKSFIYLEMNPLPPTKLWRRNHPNQLPSIENTGYGYEEYGLYKNHVISLSEYGDGAANLNGKIVQLDGSAEHRVRCLTRNNLLITAKLSPLNNRNADDRTEKMLDDILYNRDSGENFSDYANSLPKHFNDD